MLESLFIKIAGFAELHSFQRVSGDSRKLCLSTWPGTLLTFSTRRSECVQYPSAPFGKRFTVFTEIVISREPKMPETKMTPFLIH